jgi:hypothetical protein
MYHPSRQRLRRGSALTLAAFSFSLTMFVTGCSRNAQPDPASRAEATAAARTEIYRAIRAGDVALETAWSRRTTAVADAISAANEEVSTTMATVRQRAYSSTTITPQTRATLRIYAAAVEASRELWTPAARAEDGEASLQRWNARMDEYHSALLRLSEAPAGSEAAYESYQALVASYNRWAEAANVLVDEVRARPESLLEIYALLHRGE